MQPVPIYLISCHVPEYQIELYKKDFAALFGEDSLQIDEYRVVKVKALPGFSTAVVNLDMVRGYTFGWFESRARFSTD